ncbi:MAG: hypothetical protein RLZZ387_5280, partial [Chloroflexota bacterium]
MGNSLQRLEVLFVGAIMLVAGLVAVLLLFVRPPPQPTYIQATAVPVSALGATPAPSAEPAIVPTTAPQPTVATSEVVPAPSSLSGAAPSVLLVAWPFLLLAVGVGGLGLTGGRIVRRRRMAYTGQSVGMLLDASDAATREANLRVMQDLHAQGHLPPELAVAAGLHGGKRVLRLPTVKLPTVKLPTVKLPTIRLPERTAPVQPPMVVAPEAAPAPTSAAPLTGLGGAVVEADPARTMRDDELGSLLAAHEVTLPEVIIPAASPGESDAGWSAEDRALAVAAALAQVWSAERFVSPVLAIDTATAPGSAQVVVTVDAVPDEDERLTALPDRLAAIHPTWRARWRPAQQQTATLSVDVQTAGALPGAGGPLIAPVLHHGRGGKVARYFPLGTWRHLGFYGGGALGALHALVTSLLYTQPPANTAFAVLDQGQISPLYRGVAHQVQAPGDVRVTCEALTRALRRGGGSRADVRPLLLLVVEPDAEALAALTALLARLRQQPSAPVHLLIAQERLSAAGRELYAMLPALITSGGQGAASWLPGQQGEWPRRDAARLVGRGMRVEGRAIAQTEAEAAELLAALRRTPAALPPVLWDAPALVVEEEVVTQDVAPLPDAPPPVTATPVVVSQVVPVPEAPLPVDVPVVEAEASTVPEPPAPVVEAEALAASDVPSQGADDAAPAGDEMTPAEEEGPVIVAVDAPPPAAEPHAAAPELLIAVPEAEAPVAAQPGAATAPPVDTVQPDPLPVVPEAEVATNVPGGEGTPQDVVADDDDPIFGRASRPVTRVVV